MIKDKDKIKTSEQFFNIVFDNKEDVIEFLDNFKITKESKYNNSENCDWYCNFESRWDWQKTIEVGFNNDSNNYGGEINGFGCGELDFDLTRCGEFYYIWDTEYKTKKTFYKKLKNSFLSLLNIMKETQDEDDEKTSNKLEHGAKKYFNKSYDELTNDEIEELGWNLDGEYTYNMMVAEGWIDED